MAGIAGKKGRDLLLAILAELRNIDPRIVPFDSDEVQELEYAVAQAVREIFGSGSPEYTEFEEFRIVQGSISRGDSRAEKQSKYELGLPKAIGRLAELLSHVDQSGENIQDLAPGDLIEIDAAGKDRPGKPSPPKAVPRARTRESDPAPPPPETPRAPSRTPQQKTEPKPETGAHASAAKAPPKASPQPGRILLLQEGGDQIREAVAALLQKIGIETALLDEGGSSGMEGIVGLKNIAFAVMSVSSETRGGLSGLTSVIGKPHPRHESTFKLGLLVGVLGPGRVVILHSGERPQDIPEDLFGIRYIPFKEEGGWQIGLLKLLKANGFFIDANLLFD